MAEHGGPAPNPAEAYERHLVPSLFAPWAADLLRRVAPRPGERVLDVACGTGIVARRIVPLVHAAGAAGQVVGLDVSPAMLAVARARAAAEGAQIEWREADAVALPFPAGAFDLVLCQQGLQFVPDRPAAVREMRRVLAPEGRVAVAAWRDLAFHPVYRALGEALRRRLGTGFEAPFSLGEAGDLRALLEQAGLRRVTVEPVTRQVRFPDPEQFVDLSIRGAAAVISAFTQIDEAGRRALVEAIRREVDAVLQVHLEGNVLTMPMHAHVATGQA